MALGSEALHWVTMVVADTEVSPPVRLMEYQSADRLRPGIKVGVSTAPPEMVRATSGRRLALPEVTVFSETVAWVLGSLAVLTATEPGENRSGNWGARMSTDQVVRS